MDYVGKTIEIVYMEGEPQMAGRRGVVQRQYKDPWGEERLDGTWGIAVYIGKDFFKVID